MAKTYVVEHLDPELGPWSALEYVTIAQESDAAGAKFCLSSVSKDLNLPPELLSASSLRVEQRDADSIFQNEKETVCLLDPAAKKELGPDDNVKFDVFLFGGILGDDPPRGKSERDPLRALLTWIDRTSQLRKQGFEGRRLGPVQMTTDTAVRVTRKVIQDGGLEWFLFLNDDGMADGRSFIERYPIRRFSRTQARRARKHRDAIPLHQRREWKPYHARGSRVVPCGIW